MFQKEVLEVFRPSPEIMQHIRRALAATWDMEPQHVMNVLANNCKVHPHVLFVMVKQHQNEVHTKMRKNINFNSLYSDVVSKKYVDVQSEELNS